MTLEENLFVSLCTQMVVQDSVITNQDIAAMVKASLVAAKIFRHYESQSDKITEVIHKGA